MQIYSIKGNKMKNRVITNIILALIVTTNIHAMQTECKEVPESIALAQSLENKMYDEAEALMQIFKTKINHYRKNCNNSQDMFEQTQISIFTYEDKLADLKEDLKSSKSVESVDCTKVPNTLKLVDAFEQGKQVAIETSYQAYMKGSQNYLDNCTAHEDYGVVFEESASFDDDYNKWKKSLNI